MRQPSSLRPYAASHVLAVSGDHLVGMDGDRSPPSTLPSAERLRELQAVVDDHIIIAVTDRRGSIVKVNRAFARISGYSEDELIGQNHRILSSGVHGRDFWKQMWRTVSSGNAWHGEVCNCAKDGSTYWVDTTIFPLKDDLGLINGYLAVRIEITDSARIRTALADTLTGLPGRAFLMHRLRTMLRRAVDRPGRICALCFLDLDNFKYVNDSLGHGAGDQVLIETAHRLTSAIAQGGRSGAGRLADTDHRSMVARFGGDEFVLLLDDLPDVEAVIAVVDRVKTLMAEPVLIGGQAIPLHCSIGIAIGRGSDVEGDALLRDADTAMYHAKAAGKNRYAIFDEQMHTSVRRRLRLEGELRLAIAEKRIETWYQPIVDLESGRVIAFEGLARWNHQELGSISPSEFIPIAEESGLIVALSRDQLVRVVDVLADLDRSHGHHDLRMNVNISRRQLSDSGFGAWLRHLLASRELAPGRLCLEITESAVTGPLEPMQRSLGELKAIGVQLHMDDFGTGLSSLSLLRKLPLDGIKVDRSFIEAAEGDPEAISILHAIIALGRNLRKTITAEGLETATHLATVIGLDCNFAQGWLFGAAARAEDLPSLLATDSSHRISKAAGS
jgi:diguanylate cyclase (GGDEF)-like protein/PAS domain S-box-containing protein